MNNWNAIYAEQGKVSHTWTLRVRYRFLKNSSVLEGAWILKTFSQLQWTVYTRSLFIIKDFFFFYDNDTIIELYFPIETIFDFIPYSTAFVSRSHDHPSRARILTSAGPPFSNNLLIARPRNSVEKDPVEWTVWSLTLEWWSESHGYIVVQWHVCIYTLRTEIARRRRKCTRIRFETGVNNTDKCLLL